MGHPRMLLPISHDKMSVRRMPVVTIALVFLTVALHVLLTLSDRATLVETEDLEEAALSLSSQRFGYVPARANLLGLVTHVFVHGDIWHLVGNMWFLFLCGLALEDRWGRVAFPAYYLVGGVVAAGVHHVARPDSHAALIGASGAVAAAMGAFLVLFGTSRIRFVGALGFRVFSFHAPAYVMLPLWAGIEIVYGLTLRASHTAHWAHVGGFAFGAAVALVFRVAGVDRKLDDAVERAAVLGDDPRVDAARALVERGEADQAVALLEGLAKEKPSSVHVREALRDARASATARAAGRSSASASATSVKASASAKASASVKASATSGESHEDGAPFFPPPPGK